MMQFKHTDIVDGLEIVVTLDREDLHIEAVHELYLQFLRGVGYVVRPDEVLEYINENLKDYSRIECASDVKCCGGGTQYQSATTELTSEGLALR